MGLLRVRKEGDTLNMENEAKEQEVIHWFKFSTSTQVVEMISLFACV